MLCLMAVIDHLLADIEVFIGEAQVSETTFGRRAVNDGKFVGRLREGAGVTVATVERVRAYIAEQRQRMTPSKRRSAT